MYLWLPTSKCSVDLKRPSLSSWIAMVQGLRNRSSHARETLTFRNTQKSTCNLGGASSLRSCFRPDSFRTPTQVLSRFAAKYVFCCNAGRGARPTNGSAVTNQTLRVKCRPQCTEHSLLRHLETASAKVVIWPLPSTVVSSSLNLGLPSFLGSVIFRFVLKTYRT